MNRNRPTGDWDVGALSTVAGTGPRCSLPSYDDQQAWDRLCGSAALAPLVERVVDRADAVRSSEALRTTTASQYLDYDRTGDLNAYHSTYAAQRTALSALAVAECLDREGRYLDAVLDHAWTVCEATTWVLPAHRSEGSLCEGLPAVDAAPTVDLNAATTALLLAELDDLLGDRLHPALRGRIRAEVERRVLMPYETENHWWTDAENNWNAVCTAGCVGAAIHLLDDEERVARFVARAADSTERYLAGFGADGCTQEGMGYWNFGVGHFVVLADLVESWTGGERSLVSAPITREIAAYPRRVELSPGRYVPFSDAAETDGLLPYAACWLGRRFDRPALAARGRYELATAPALAALHRLRRNLFWPLDAPRAPVAAPPERTYFADNQWWLVRDDAEAHDTFVVAAKGGHNGESHNHLDCGSFVTHVRGESLLTDLGKPVYDAGYFGEERYEYLTTQSLGHSVPHVNGHEQAVGREHAARMLNRTESAERETFALDLTTCYPDAAGIGELHRRFMFDRGAPMGRLRVTDTVWFAPDAGREFVSVLVSYCPLSVEDGTLWVDGERATLRVDAGPGDVGVAVERLPAALDRDRWRMNDDGGETGASDVWRARLSPDPDATVDVDGEGGEGTRRLRLDVTPSTAWERFGGAWNTTG
ncbi:heparinase II/III domain-containing protein [Halomarina oriensis]|uniref:Heparinase n=1 Tax=Halomarina oriensis TaxID=671145 RepID=A0A6B0GGJ3_9EURY|nr:heparinase II/III family protein [Halomarina oriensis]MWG33844.1 heparinase [Halomarina oriensis]